MDTSQNNIQIDAVFTWVDGNDQKHIDKMMPYMSGKNNWKNKKFKTRFQQVNEIEYSVKSIIKFAPFIQNIYIVTDGQTPSFLEQYNKTKKETDPTITIVDHSVIFRDFIDALPVFNSMSIETLIYKIPNLSEHFIYFNDDLFLLNPVKPTDFFINGLPVLRGKWTKFDDKIFYKKLHNFFLLLQRKETKNNKYGYKRSQQIGAKIIGFNKKYFKSHHTPTPLRKSTIKNFYEKNESVLKQNIKYKFRSPKQFIPQILINHIEIKNNNAILKSNLQLLFLSSFKKPVIWYKILFNFNKKYKTNIFLCLQSLDKAPKKTIDFIISWLIKTFK